MKKKQTIFMPPAAVREAEDTGPDSITLDAVRKMGRTGGKAGIRWARRIMRQEGVIKASTTGDTFIPVAVDLQLGPEIFAGIVNESVDDVISQFDKANISASCLPVAEGTLAFFVDYPGEFDEAIAAKFPVDKIDPTKMVMIDESKAKLKSIVKAAWKTKDMAGFKCYGIEDPIEIAGIQFDKLFLLRSPDSMQESTRIIKVDKGLGLVLGWAIISTIDGESYFDKQGDHIPDEAMLEASTDFMINSRVQGDMHVKDKFNPEVAKDAGTVVFCWPMTAEIAKAFNIQVEQTGLMIAIKPDSDEILKKYEDGTYTGFSIGGFASPDFTEEVS